MRRFVFPLAILTVALAPALLVANDQQIAQTVVERLAREKDAGSLRDFELDLKVDNGQVWVQGRVASPQQQNLVLDVARRVPGVVQVVNDLSVESQLPAEPSFDSGYEADDFAPPTPENQDRGLLATMFGGNGASGGDDNVQPVANEQALSARRSGLPQSVGTGAMPHPAAMRGQPHPAAMQHPQARGPHAGMPLAYAPAQMADARGGGGMAMQPMGNPGGPRPTYVPNQGGVTPVAYDHPSMPNYSWPSYASYPNYAALTYPQQYSPTAWPYIGPFYPYPQVPLGWRKVTLEWDDGWWFLDFNDGSRRRRYQRY